VLVRSAARLVQPVLAVQQAEKAAVRGLEISSDGVALVAAVAALT
jgi:hypothetical protein